MTTNTNPRRNTSHRDCAHPATKADRARCRAARALVTAVYASAVELTPRPALDVPERDVHFSWLMGPKPEPVTRPTYEPCTCTGKPKGFHADADDVWVCVTCERPTALYLKALGL